MDYMGWICPIVVLVFIGGLVLYSRFVAPPEPRPEVGEPGVHPGEENQIVPGSENSAEQMREPRST
jgi:hypothetical protein